MKKYYCYICENEELTPENKSEEHVIQNSIGGHLKSSNLICHKINTTLFKGFDDKLRDSLIFFRSRITFEKQRDRGHNIKLTGKDIEGFPYKVDENLYFFLSTGL